MAFLMADKTVVKRASTDETKAAKRVCCSAAPTAEMTVVR
jgi:hypothetical protein